MDHRRGSGCIAQHLCLGPELLVGPQLPSLMVSSLRTETAVSMVLALLQALLLLFHRLLTQPPKGFLCLCLGSSSPPNSLPKYQLDPLTLLKHLRGSAIAVAIIPRMPWGTSVPKDALEEAVWGPDKVSECSVQELPALRRLRSHLSMTKALRSAARLACRWIRTSDTALQTYSITRSGSCQETTNKPPHGYTLGSSGLNGEA